MPNWYNGKKMLQQKTLSGGKPEIFISNSNRSAGKTTFFNRELVQAYFDAINGTKEGVIAQTIGVNKNSPKFMLIYRYDTELKDISDQFFGEISNLFYKGHVMTERSRANGRFLELFLDEVSCGYAVSLNSALKLKKYSHFFCDVGFMQFDEYQVTRTEYIPDEITKFRSLHQTVARGGGMASRYVPVFMIGNQLSSVNPYYSAFGITDRLQKDTRFLHGGGWVVEQGLVKDVINIMKESTFENCFVDSDYLDKQGGGSYLFDNDNMICAKPKKKFIYTCTFIYNSKEYAIWTQNDGSMLYIDDRADKNYPIRVAVTNDDMTTNTYSLKFHSGRIAQYREMYDASAIRFKNIESKNAFLSLVKYV